MSSKRKRSRAEDKRWAILQRRADRRADWRCWAELRTWPTRQVWRQFVAECWWHRYARVKIDRNWDWRPQAAVADAEPQVTYARAGEDLRDVALRVLGSFDGWRDLASLNGLAGSEVAPGTALLVPVGTRKLRTLT